MHIAHTASISVVTMRCDRDMTDILTRICEDPREDGGDPSIAAFGNDSHATRMGMRSTIMHRTLHRSDQYVGQLAIPRFSSIRTAGNHSRAGTCHAQTD